MELGGPICNKGNGRPFVGPAVSLSTRISVYFLRIASADSFSASVT